MLVNKNTGRLFCQIDKSQREPGNASRLSGFIRAKVFGHECVTWVPKIGEAFLRELSTSFIRSKTNCHRNSCSKFDYLGDLGDFGTF